MSALVSTSVRFPPRSQSGRLLLAAGTAALAIIVPMALANKSRRSNDNSKDSRRSRYISNLEQVGTKTGADAAVKEYDVVIIGGGKCGVCLLF